MDSFPRFFQNGAYREVQMSELREENAFLISLFPWPISMKEEFLEGGASDLSNFICRGAVLSFQSCFQSDSDNRTAYR